MVMRMRSTVQAVNELKRRLSMLLLIIHLQSRSLDLEALEESLKVLPKRKRYTSQQTRKVLLIRLDLKMPTRTDVLNKLHYWCIKTITKKLQNKLKRETS